MNFYEEYCLPHLINCACGMKEIARQRSKVVPMAEGDVLEIGMGSGLNLRHYDKSKVKKLWGLEPSDGMRRKAQKNILESEIDVEWLGLPSEQIPLDDASVDTIVLTYTLCTIADTVAALSEMHRVLKPKGKLVFSEHGVSPEPSVQKWQARVNPIWRKLAGGCNLNRDIPHLITQGGFDIKTLDSAYVKGPKVAAYQYWGEASLAGC